MSRWSAVALLLGGGAEGPQLNGAAALDLRTVPRLLRLDASERPVARRPDHRPSLLVHQDPQAEGLDGRSRLRQALSDVVVEDDGVRTLRHRHGNRGALVDAAAGFGALCGDGALRLRVAVVMLDGNLQLRRA